SPISRSISREPCHRPQPPGTEHLAHRAGRALAQEARRKGVHVLLAPTVNLHRSPLGGRHFEAYSEDPHLTAAIGTGYVRGVQDGGVAAAVKHFVANDAETDRFTVDNVVAPRPLRELYLAPFEAIVRDARPWAVMAAYNRVNGVTMTEHRHLQTGVLRGEWGFDGVTVSDWFAVRSTTGALRGGLDLAMPGPNAVYGEAPAAAVRDGELDEERVDTAVRRVLRLAARVGALEGAEPAVTTPPEPVDGPALAREIAHRSFVLLRNADGVLPLDPSVHPRIALIGAAARDARVLGGGSAHVFPARTVSPLDGLVAALPPHTVGYAVGAEPDDEPAPAGTGFSLRSVCRDAEGAVLDDSPLPTGQIQWIGADLPAGAARDTLHSVEITGTFTPRESGAHVFGTRGLGAFTLTVAGRVLYDGVQEAGTEPDPFEAFTGAPVERGTLALTAGEPVDVSLRHIVDHDTPAPVPAVVFSLLHRPPRRDPGALVDEAVAAARAADTAVVVVATTERVESEGFDRADLRLPGRQDDLVRAVAAANPRTVVVVNAGAPVEMPWRDEVAAVLLTWFPGQEGGAALADVLLGVEEPGGRLPTTWPAALADAPVTRVAPEAGRLPYDEGLFIGYRAWDRAGTAPAYPFGHGLGYTTWEYESLEVTPTFARVTVRNTGRRPGRETVQLYVAPRADLAERPARLLVGFATVQARPGETAEAEIRLAPRTFDIWDETSGEWTGVPGVYDFHAGSSLTDRRLTVALELD
ncbi:glycoside hydrolase family 3 C-terminal domain-containing protein, partial [Streptomyces sp. MUM 203J]|uniref:beta-glucosidase family protein n=1 Tax=Streptomyces sp. MUM 203J TaxID=2791990 RepID=UPI001F04C750